MKALNMLRKKSRGKRADFPAKSYRAEFFRKKMLAKSFKGNEKGYKSLDRLAETIQTGMEVLWRQGVMCDIELVTTDRKHFRVHRLVLVTCSDYFYDLLVEPEDGINFQIEIPDIRGDTLECILEAMYTGKVKTEANNVDDLLVAANMLGMFVIFDACQQFLLDIVNKENCLQLLATSFKYNLTQLTEQSLKVAADQFLSVSKTQAFRLLPVEHLIPLLKRDDLNVNSELEVFHRARAWLEDNRQYRRQHAADVLATIRLPMLTPAEIVDNVENCTAVADVNGCQKLVKEALHYHLMPSRQCLLQSPRTVPRRKGELSLVATGGAPRLTSDAVVDTVTRYNVEDNRWELVTKMPEPRHHHAVAVLNGFLYIAGGDVVTDACTPVNTVHRFDPRTGSWMRVASMLNCRQSFQLCVLNSALYAVGGRVSTEELLSAVEKYDPSMDRWEEVASLSCPRRCVAVGSMTGRLYAVGGSSAKAISSRAERYNPTENKWEMIRATNTPRFFGHLQSITTFLYLIGGAGIDNKGNIVCVDTIERYANSTNQWTVISNMRTPRSEAGCTVIREKIYVVGGYNWNNYERSTDVECFDTETNNWTTLPKIKQPLTGIAAVSLVVYKNKHNDVTNNANLMSNSCDINSVDNDKNQEKERKDGVDKTSTNNSSSVKEVEKMRQKSANHTDRQASKVDQDGKLKNAVTAFQEIDINLEVGREHCKTHITVNSKGSTLDKDTKDALKSSKQHTVKTMEKGNELNHTDANDNARRTVKSVKNENVPENGNKDLKYCKRRENNKDRTSVPDEEEQKGKRKSEQETVLTEPGGHQDHIPTFEASSEEGDVHESRTYPDLSNNCSNIVRLEELDDRKDFWYTNGFRVLKTSAMSTSSTCDDNINADY